MSSHVELNPDDSTLGLSLGMKAMRLALTQKTHKMGTVRIPTQGDTDVIIGDGAQDGANRIDQDGNQMPIVDTSGIDKAAQDAQQSADKAIAKADEAISKGEQIRQDAQAGIDDARKAAQDAAAKADKVRSDLQSEVDKVKANVADVDAKADSDKAELEKSVAALDKRVSDVSANGDKMAGQITDITGTVNGQQTKLHEFGTKLDGAITKNDTTVKSVTELKQTVTGLSSTVSQTTKTASDAMSKATSVEQTANGLKATLSKDYTSTKNADLKYSTKAELSATSESLSSSISSVRGTADGAVTAASKARQTADAVTVNLSKNYQTKAQNDAVYATQTSLKATSDSLSANITANTKTAQSAVDKATNLEANLNGFKTTVSQTYGRGSNLWVNPTFDADKPQITSLVDNVTAPNGSRVNLLASRDHHNNNTSFPVVPGHTYVITAHIKRIKGDLSLHAGIWYTAQTSGNSYDGYRAAESTSNLSDGWVAATWRLSCPNGKSRGCVYFQIDNVPPNNVSTQWYVANVVCVDVTGLQPAGDYATNSSLTQTANSIKAQVTEVSKTANGAMSKATTVEQTANGLSTKITEQAKTINATVTTANEAKSTADSNKITISQTANLVDAALAGDNLITDGGFESTEWWKGLKTPFRISNGSFYHGKHVLVCDAATGDNRCPLTHEKGMAGTAATIPVTKGRTYRLSGYCVWYGSVPSNVNPSGDKLRLAKPDGSFIAEAQCSKSTSWSETHVDWKCPDDGSITSVRIEVMHQANGSILWDDVAFRDITEAAETSNRVSSVQQNLDGFKTTVSNTYQTKAGMSSYATTSHLTQTANQIRGEVSEKYQSKNGMSSYATNSALTQKANEITGKVTEVAKTAQGNTTTISQVSQKADRINTTLSQQISGKADTSRVSSLEQNLDGFKTTVAKTYQTKGDYPTKTEVQSRIDQSASSIKSTVGQTYTTQTATEALRKSATRTFTLTGAAGKAKWVKLGYLTSNGDDSSVLIHVYSGDGYNGQASQNAEFEIFVKDGWQRSASATGAFGVSVSRIRNADDVKVKVMAFSSCTCDIWAYLPWAYWNGHYTLQGNYKSWQDGPNCGGTRIQDAEPTSGTAQDLAYDTLSTRSYVDQTAKSVALGVVQNYQGSDGSGLATKSDITAAKASITSTVASTYATKTGVTQEISSKITQNNNSLDVKFSTKVETQNAQNKANTADSHATNAQSRVGSLEDCINFTASGVRVGKRSNGKFTGVSALVNTNGTFDLLDASGNLLTRINRHRFQVTGDDGTGSGYLSLSQDGINITVQPTADTSKTYHIQVGKSGVGITAPDRSSIECSASGGLNIETVKYGKISIGAGGLQFTNDQGWGLRLSAAGWSLKWAGNHTLATGPAAGKLYIDGREIVTR